MYDHPLVSFVWNGNGMIAWYWGSLAYESHETLGFIFLTHAYLYIYILATSTRISDTIQLWRIKDASRKRTTCLL